MRFLSRFTVNHMLGVASLVALAIAVASCGSASTKKLSGADNDKKGADTPTPTATAAAGAYAIEISDPAPAQLITKSTADVADDTCTGNFTVTVTQGGEPKEGVEVLFSVASSVSTDDYGKVEQPAVPETDASGTVSAKYCAGDTETTVMIVAKAAGKETTSTEIEVVKKPTYTFTYTGTEEQESASFIGSLLSLFADTDPVADTVLLNLYGAGKDRINLLFATTVSGESYAGATARFVSQIDYPVGTKLGLCADAAKTAADSVTGKSYLYYDAVSNSAGVFRVPVCAGRMPGNLLVTGRLTVGSGATAKTFRAEANMVRFEGGLANYGNVSLSFDSTNAKVMKASFIGNSEQKLSFKARLQSRLDGVLAIANPLGVLSEYGKVVLDNDGKPSESGEIGFSVEPLNTTSQRPLRVTSKSISNGVDYDYMCTPGKFSATSPTQFSDLAKDWRSTIMYYVKGQEQFFDSDYDGEYDSENSVGFWDRNQNAVFDCSDDNVCDEITFVDSTPTGSDAVALGGILVGSRPLGAASCGTVGCLTAPQQAAIYNHDWFIDMPSPFVDSDENGDQRDSSGISQLAEYVVGDSFLVPNGKYDKENYIWKSFVTPFYVGTSPYALTHRVISSDLARVFRWVDSDSSGTVNAGDQTDVGHGATDLLGKFFEDTGYANTIWDSTAVSDDGNAGVQETLFGCHAVASASAKTEEKCVSASISFPATVNSQVAARYFFAQGTCGSPLPGGTSIRAWFYKDGAESDSLSWTGRSVTAQFFMQPNDWTLEPARRLLSESKGTNTAKINVDPTIHPSRRYSYPVQFYVQASACTNLCTGDVKSPPGMYCEGRSAALNVTADTDTIVEGFSIEPVDTCNPVGDGAPGGLVDAHCVAGSCKCPDGYSSDGNSCVLPPP